MKFSKRLVAELVNVWKEHYLDYKALKKEIGKLKHKAKHKGKGLGKTKSEPCLQPFENSLSDQFFELLYEEIEKVEKFFCTKHEQLVASFQELSERTRAYVLSSRHTVYELQALEDAWQVSALELNNLQNFVTLNSTGFNKIVKKHDKNTGDKTRRYIVETKLPEYSFFKTQVLAVLRTVVESKSSELAQLRNNPTIEAEARSLVTLVESLDDGKLPYVCSDEELQNLLLHIACRLGDVRLVRKLLEFNVPIEQLDVCDRTPLHAAAAMGHLKVLQLLIEQGAATSRRDFLGKVPLHYAVSEGHSLCTKVLAQNNADVLNAVDRHGCSPVMYSITHGHAGCLRELLNVVTSCNQYNLSDILRDKLPSGKILWSAIHQAAYHGEKGCIEVLLEFGEEVDVVLSTDLSSTLHSAVSGNVACLELLIEKGAPLDAENRFNETPLHLAIRYNKVEMLRVLCNNAPTPLIEGATWNTDKECEPLLHEAAIAGSLSCVQILLEAGANPRLEGTGGWTARTHALFLGYHDVAQRLLKAMTTTNGYTAATIKVQPETKMPNLGEDDAELDREVVLHAHLKLDEYQLRIELGTYEPNRPPIQLFHRYKGYHLTK